MNNAYKRTVWLMGIRVTANVLTLGALCVAMYMSYLHPSEALLTFCQWFFGITIATWYVCRKLGQYVRRTLADQDEGLVRLPGHRKAAVMKWKIAAPSAIVMSRPGRQEA